MRKMYYQSPVGRLELTADEKGLCSLAFGETEQYAEVQEEETPFLKSVCGQLQEYFAGKRKKFEVQLSLHGTDFQLRDWQALLWIPYGDEKLWRDRPADRMPQGQQGSGDGQPEQSGCDYRSLPPGDWLRRKPDRLYGKEQIPGYQGISFKAGRSAVKRKNNGAEYGKTEHRKTEYRKTEYRSAGLDRTAPGAVRFEIPGFSQ